MAKGKTFYVDHVEANIPWTTKETPLNVRTKGALKFKNALLRIEDGLASIDHLTDEDEQRIKAAMPTRIIFSYLNQLLWVLKHNDIAHKPCKMFKGACGSRSYVLEIAREDLTMMALAYAKMFQILNEDHPYYAAYDNEKYGEIVDLDPNYEGKIESDLEEFDDDDLDED